MISELEAVKQKLESLGFAPIITKMGQIKRKRLLSVPFSNESESLFGELFKHPTTFHVGPNNKFICSDYLQI
jgi:hypothetical protein